MRRPLAVALPGSLASVVVSTLGSSSIAPGEESQAVRKTNRVREKRRGRNCVRFRDVIAPERLERKWN
jgi:hypothetical protein